MTSHYSFGCRGGFKAWARDKRPPRQRVRSSRQPGQVLEIMNAIDNAMPPLKRLFSELTHYP
jgi:hypothetical protein